MAPRWVVDNEPSRRYPLYTRGNIGEVFPQPVAPLTWTAFGIPGAEQGWRDSLVEFGAFDHDEFGDDPMVILGVFGGYGYINVDIYRVIAVRTPGMTTEMMDFTFFGEHADVPPYVPRPGDESAEHTARIEQTLGRVMTATDVPELREDQEAVERVKRERGDLTALSPPELVERITRLTPMFRHLFHRHLHTTLSATIATGLVSAVCAEALHDPSLAMRLLAGIGDVDSAAPSWALWDLSRQVASSPTLVAEFDRGVDGLLDRLEGSGAAEAGSFLGAFSRFTEEYGSRGPNEWELRSPTWETRPEMALAALDRMRLAADDANPAAHQRARAQDREALSRDLVEKLAAAPEVQGQFQAGLQAAQLFLAARERSKTTIIKMEHEARLAARELGQRFVDAGQLSRWEEIGMVLVDEMPGFLADPAAFADVIAAREAQLAELEQLVPPFIVHGEPSPVETWLRRDHVVVPARPGEVLTGIPGCPGQAAGRARVVLDASHPGDFEPGDVLVAPITDPSWTPLFVPASAVVVDVGAQVSHAVIVCRELGIPCVVSVKDATRRIADGAEVTVDGTAGSVTVG